MIMYRHLIEEYLTHYQSELKGELIRNRAWEAYLDRQSATMLEARTQILTQYSIRFPSMSQFQKEMEADQTVREMFLPLP